MQKIKMIPILFGFAFLASGCGSLTPPKYENGQYVPPPAKNPLKVDLTSSSCDGTVSRAVGAALATVLATTVINQSYDRFVNWLDAKKANLSASSSGITTASLLSGANLKRCLILSRSNTLIAKFSIDPTPSGGYWHMTPYSLDFLTSEAKESPEGEKSIVAEIQFSAVGEDGKLNTFFQTTFDLGKHKASGISNPINVFIGQDSGPYGKPKVSTTDTTITMKVTASIVEHGEGRDWIRGVTDSFREQENRDKILKPLLDAIAKKTQ